MAIETPPRNTTTGQFVSPGGTAVAEPPPKAAADKPKEQAEQAGLKAFYKQHFHKDPKAEPEPPKPEPKVEPKEPKPEPKPRRRSPAPRPPSVADIGKAVGEAVREAIQPKVEKKDEPASKLDEGLDDDEKETLRVLQEMATLNPDKHKELPGKFATGQRELRKYEKQWEKEHPGEDFKIDAEEHAEFLEKHNPEWSDGDFTKAERSLIKKEVKDEVSKEFQPKLSEIQQREREREAAPVIHNEAIAAAKQFWGQMPEQYKGVLNADGTVNDDILNKIQQEDPDGYEEVMKVATGLNHEIVELRKLFPMEEGKPRLIDFDPGNPIHRAIDAFGVQLEQDILHNPPDKQLNDEGDQFLPNDQYYRLPKAERKGHWTLTFKEVKDGLILDRAERVKKAIKDLEERFLRRAKSRNFVQNGEASAGAASRPAERQPADMRSAPEEKPDGPGGHPTSRMAANMRKRGEEGKTAQSSFLGHHFGRKL